MSLSECILCSVCDNPQPLKQTCVICKKVKYVFCIPPTTCNDKVPLHCFNCSKSSPTPGNSSNKELVRMVKRLFDCTLCNQLQPVKLECQNCDKSYSYYCKSTGCFKLNIGIHILCEVCMNARAQRSIDLFQVPKKDLSTTSPEISKTDKRSKSRRRKTAVVSNFGIVTFGKSVKSAKASKNFETIPEEELNIKEKPIVPVENFQKQLILKDGEENKKFIKGNTKVSSASFPQKSDQGTPKSPEFVSSQQLIQSAQEIANTSINVANEDGAENLEKIFPEKPQLWTTGHIRIRDITSSIHNCPELAPFKFQTLRDQIYFEIARKLLDELLRRKQPLELQVLTCVLNCAVEEYVEMVQKKK